MAALGRAWRAPRARWPRRIAVIVAALVVVPVVTAGAALRVTYMGDLQDGTRTRGRDAIWMGHAWVDGRKDDADLAAFARRIKGTGIRDLYVHAGPLEHDGTLPAARYSRASWLIAAVHRTMPGVRVHAWLGDVLATEGPEGLRLSRAATREAVLGSARQVLDAGFDGVHLDLEPLHSGDRDFLLLLDEVHALTRGRGALLSVATAQIDPVPSLHAAARAVTGHPKWWSQAYFHQVALRVDQVAVMSYDTAMPLQSLYGGYVAHQTALALEATPEATDLLMGLPFYREEDMSHHGYAETPAAAVHGLRLALGRDDVHRERFGVALYVDFAATESDWAAYRDGWGATSRA
ncbi:glycosyl hydrolase family 18 protein [Streptomyces fuscigenes]|uniref:glycosyl hydrolase family 18 protein n=1 Tax=Streptomyces fuscigenes TaxID=1528880 RepID=UPI001F36277C|nr:glycosyl hydrolase family 18 protein [Streptomyces fuscigenes]MCF3962146.1 glycosyl hydrolase family 18 protein [Streptomyces fuscigenes]